MKLLEKITPKEEMEKAILDVETELGIITKEEREEKGKFAFRVDETVRETLVEKIEVIAEIFGKKDLERILKENGDNNHD